MNYYLLNNIGYDVTSHYDDSILAFKRRFMPDDLSLNKRDKLLKVAYSVYLEFVKIRVGY